MRTPFGSSNNKYEISADIIQPTPPVCPPPSINEVIGLTAELNNRVHISRIGASNGIAPLDIDSKIPSAYLPNSGESCCTYQLPASIDLTAESIGRVVCLDDNGKVVLYQDTPASAGTMAKYEITFNSFHYEGGSVAHAVYVFDVAELEVGGRVQIELPTSMAYFKSELWVLQSDAGSNILYNSDPIVLAEEVISKVSSQLMATYLYMPFKLYHINNGKIAIKISSLYATRSESNYAIFSIFYGNNELKFKENFYGGNFSYRSPINEAGEDLAYDSSEDGNDKTPYLVFETLNGGGAISRKLWLQNGIPSSPTQELLSLLNTLNEIEGLSELYQISVSSNKLILEENYAFGSKLYFVGDESLAKVTKIRDSVVAMHKLPTRMPLGRLDALDNNVASINANYITTYKANAAITIPPSMYNFKNLMDASMFFKPGGGDDREKIKEFLMKYGQFFVLPTDNGLVRVFDITVDLPLDELETENQIITIPYISFFRHGIIGLAVTGTDENLNIPVMNMQHFSLLGVNFFQLFMTWFNIQERKFEVYENSPYNYTGMTLEEFLDGRRGPINTHPPSGSGTGSGSGDKPTSPPPAGPPPTGSGW